MQKRKNKDRIYLSMHEGDRDLLVVALRSHKNTLEKITRRSPPSETWHGGVVKFSNHLALEQQIRDIERILKQL